MDRDEFIKNVEHCLSLIGQQYGDEEDEGLTCWIMDECVSFLKSQGYDSRYEVSELMEKLK